MTRAFAPYDAIMVINLKHRVDRRKAMLKTLRSIGLEDDPRVRFVEAERPSDAGRFLNIGHHGCFLSHLKCHRLAHEEGKSLLLLEDDCEFAPDARSVRVPDGTDIFYGGCEIVSGGDPMTSDIIGAHCMGFSREAVRTSVDFLGAMLQPGYHPDPSIADAASYDGSILAPVDGAYVWMRRSAPHLKTHFASPPIASQRPSSSDITPGRLDRIPLLRPVLDTLRALRMQLRGR